MFVSSIVFNPEPGDDTDALNLTLKRCTPEATSVSANGLTLLCLHGAGSLGDKEQWEPVEWIFATKAVKIREAFYREFGAEWDRALATAIMIVNARRTTWASREEAFEYMANKFIWKGWYARVLSAYVSHGLHDVPGTPDGKSNSVCISTSNAQEISAYRLVPPHLEAVDQYRRIAKQLPVHFIYGARNDLVQESSFDPTQGIVASSIQHVPRAGHMVLEENPDGLAEAMSGVLEQLSTETLVGVKTVNLGRRSEHGCTASLREFLTCPLSIAA
ncbi:hypothetical protein FB45DRAFT_1024309 [Roridomyces roridus]|uniref:AB hydrolase-1 domain-containing protein n=1 Tax=Roridomyces roridus TaxID=1738132 RepID=A0AAD7FT32_9AGAR|nr:hypothetical protein FB45DRAFT_1024309 [Roridomyces roridus]